VGIGAIRTVKKLKGVRGFLIACQFAQMEEVWFKRFRGLKAVEVSVVSSPGPQLTCWNGGLILN
jgi:hypothetical protein